MIHWQDVAEFFAMGGYALYVWGSIGATALVLLAEVLGVRARGRAIRAELAMQGSDAADGADGATAHGERA